MVIVASVSCIFGLGSPEEYGNVVLTLKKGERRKRDKVLRFLTDIHYERNDFNFIARQVPGSRGHAGDPSRRARTSPIRVEFWGDEVERITEVDPLTGEVLVERAQVDIYPAKHFVTTQEKLEEALKDIEAELHDRLAELRAEEKLVEAQTAGAADPLRHGDDAGDGLLQRRRELLAAPLAGGPREASRGRCSTTSRMTS